MWHFSEQFLRPTKTGHVVLSIWHHMCDSKARSSLDSPWGGVKMVLHHPSVLGSSPQIGES